MQSSVASVLPTPTADLTSRLRQLMQLRSVYPEIQRGSFFFFSPTVREELTSWSDDVVVAVTVSLGEEKNWVTVGEGDDCYWSLENLF